VLGLHVTRAFGHVTVNGYTHIADQVLGSRHILECRPASRDYCSRSMQLTDGFICDYRIWREAALE